MEYLLFFEKSQKKSRFDRAPTCKREEVGIIWTTRARDFWIWGPTRGNHADN